jgi:predicted transcriptional regulator with HTH domain
MEKAVKDKLKIHGYDVFMSVGKSETAAIVLLCLKLAGGKATVAELAEKTSKGYTNIKRAVYGHGDRVSRSLIGTRLVTAEAIADTDTQIIVLTGKGQDVVKTLEDAGFAKIIQIKK